jgi:hypothetical protein
MRSLVYEQAIGVDINAEALALESLGAAYVPNSRAEPDLIRRIRELTGGGAHASEWRADS